MRISDWSSDVCSSDLRAIDIENAALAAVGMKMRRQDAGRVAGLEHHRAGAIAEQHAGASVTPVKQAREHFGTDHQCALRLAAGDEFVSHCQCVDEAGADRLHVQDRKSTRLNSSN